MEYVYILITLHLGREEVQESGTISTRREVFVNTKCL